MSYPMKMIPAFKDYLWGGERLVSEYGKQTPLRPVAESWEISCHPDGPSFVANGFFAGQSLSDVLSKNPTFAGQSLCIKEFPILIKYIDARQDLSVQVHPSDDYALRHENQLGKNECWFVVAAEPGAQLILGSQKSMSKQALRQHIEQNTLTAHLHAVPVQAGDFFEIPAGLLHAIGAGCLIAEVQQSSNVTYRVHDYGRVGADGKPRALHIEKALDTIDTSLSPGLIVKQKRHRKIAQEGHLRTVLTDWPFFGVDLLEMKEGAALQSDEARFQCLMVLDSPLSVLHEGTETKLCPGESLFIPAGIGTYVLRGSGSVLLVTPHSVRA